MRSETFRYATAVGAMERATEYRERMEGRSYFERVQFANEVLGGNWIFRLADVVGIDQIEETRSSWTDFYVENEYGTNLPTDPIAPETREYLGSEGEAKEFGFYCGMGFDGYVEALKTVRKVDAENLDVRFDEYHLDHVTEKTLQKEEVFEENDTIQPDTYYRIYGETLDQLFENFERIVSEIRSMETEGPIDDGLERQIINSAAASKLLLCGAHRGCGSHHSVKEATSSRLDSILTFLYARSFAEMEYPLGETERKAR